MKRLGLDFPERTVRGYVPILSYSKPMCCQTTTAAVYPCRDHPCSPRINGVRSAAGDLLLLLLLLSSSHSLFRPPEVSFLPCPPRLSRAAAAAAAASYRICIEPRLIVGDNRQHQQQQGKNISPQRKRFVPLERGSRLIRDEYGKVCELQPKNDKNENNARAREGRERAERGKVVIGSLWLSSRLPYLFDLVIIWLSYQANKTGSSTLYRAAIPNLHLICLLFLPLSLSLLVCPSLSIEARMPYRSDSRLFTDSSQHGNLIKCR